MLSAALKNQRAVLEGKASAGSSVTLAAACSPPDDDLELEFGVEEEDLEDSSPW